MNILANYNWIKDFLKKPADVDAFIERMTASGMTVDYAHNLSERFEGMVVGVVKEVADHPDADRLKVVKTDIGKKVVQIVCGGVNLVPDQKVVVAPPGSKARWHGEEEWTELKEVKVRGVSSYGMICAGEELGFEKLPHASEAGPLIWNITHATDAPAGTPIKEALELDDVLFDIEVTTNRPDAMSIIGLAREAAAVKAGSFNWQPKLLPKDGPRKDFSVRVEDKERCLRYQAVVIDGVTVKESPWWLQKRLLLSGHRPINNLVDITNYILHEYGQPMHTFDYEKIENGEIVVRAAKNNEKFLALDEETYELKKEHRVIADKKGPIALAAVMGRLESGTNEESTCIVLECATFEPVSVRRTARDVSLYSDSQQLFEKGLSPEATTPALARAIELVQELAGGKVASKVIDVRSSEYKSLAFDYKPSQVNARLGINLTEDEQIEMLELLGFDLERSSDDLYNVTVPYWRDHDIEDPVDFSEEIGRIYGYENIPPTMPVEPVTPGTPDPSLVYERHAKKWLKQLGIMEVFHYSFASEADLADWGIKRDEALSFINPLTVDHQYLRLSLVPSILRTIERNQGHAPDGTVFEYANIYLPNKNDLPTEEPHLVVVGYGETSSDFLKMKGVLERLMRQFGISDMELVRTKDNRYHSGRSASVLVGGKAVGIIGELAPTLRNEFGIDARTAVLDLNMSLVIPNANTSKSYSSIPAFPSVRRDVAMLVDERLEFTEIKHAFMNVEEIVRDVLLFDVYQGVGIPEGKKSVAVRVVLRADDKTLSSEDADTVLTKIHSIVEKTFKGTVR